MLKKFGNSRLKKKAENDFLYFTLNILCRVSKKRLIIVSRAQFRDLNGLKSKCRRVRKYNFTYWEVSFLGVY